MMRRRTAGGTGSRGEGAHRYRMQEKLISIGDDYWIEDNAGERVFKVDGKALRLRNTLILQNKEGQDLYRIQERMLRIRDTMEIERAGGGVAATISKTLISPLRNRWTVRVADGPDMDIQGNIPGLEYRITAGRQQVAEVSRKWFRVRDTYGVEVAPGQDDALILAITVAIDQMAHN
jgi:uncharacterized protein YxjI